MKCRWCDPHNPRYSWRSCDHCQGTGIQADPPFSGLMYPLPILETHQVDSICSTVQNMQSAMGLNLTQWYIEKIESIVYLISNVVLPNSEVLIFANYWSNPSSGDNWGTMVQRIAARVLYHAINGNCESSKLTVNGKY